MKLYAPKANETTPKNRSVSVRESGVSVCALMCACVQVLVLQHEADAKDEEVERLQALLKAMAPQKGSIGW